MTSLRIAIAATWVAFWILWLVWASRAKKGARRRKGARIRLLAAIGVLFLAWVLQGAVLDAPAEALEVHGNVFPVVGTTIFACGLGFAVWARLVLGANWGMPMTTKEEPELVTAGPYGVVRHPIYTGIDIAVIGTALAVNLLGLLVAVILAVYFFFSASIEEKNLAATFRRAYLDYKARTKMLIPFVF